MTYNLKVDKDNPWDKDDFRYNIWNFIHSLPSSPEAVSKKKRDTLNEQANTLFADLVAGTEAKRDLLIDTGNPFYRIFGPDLVKHHNYGELLQGHNATRQMFTEFLEFYTTLLYLRGWQKLFKKFGSEIPESPVYLDFDPQNIFQRPSELILDT